MDKYIPARIIPKQEPNFNFNIYINKKQDDIPVRYDNFICKHKTANDLTFEFKHDHDIFQFQPRHYNIIVFYMDEMGIIRRIERGTGIHYEDRQLIGNKPHERFRKGPVVKRHCCCF